MKVKDLIEALSKCNPDAIVVLSSDAEGNSYDTLHSFWEGVYKNGEVGLKELTPELKKSGYGPEDIISGELAVVLVP